MGGNRSSPRRMRLNGATLTGAVAALVVFAASGAIALRERPFRAPSVLAVQDPLVEVASKAETLPPQMPETTVPVPNSTGPSIIHVNPEAKGSGSGVIVIRDPSALGQNLRIAHLPDKALIENTPAGPLPTRASDGRRPFDVYARPWSGARGARVAIVIGGLAVSQTGTQQAVDKLPAEVTLAFASQGNSIGRWMQAARRKGHEIMMQVPLEPFDFPSVNPGRSTLTVDASPAENVENLHWTLARTTNYTGIMNYMGARFTTDPASMAPVMAELGKRGLMYLDDGTVARSAAAAEALRNGVPFAEGDTTIDAVRERGEILKKLDEVERTARAKGFAVGIGSAFDVTVDAVASWIAEAKKRGIEIVPISAVAKDPERG
ncbi:divergent polysaccharide deacetylase family protein [Mesorhizobium sp. NBSH29]|nr:divergent polysaccharide deacetylase family protein [Mesorhizobium sp. NBSH29]